LNNNLPKQLKKECLSEPEGRVSIDHLNQENKAAESKYSSRQNYQKTTESNRSKRFKFKSQNKVNHKIYENEKLVVLLHYILGGYRSNRFYCIRYINVNKQIDSNYKNASIESDQDRIKVINETDDEIESISEGNSKKYFLF